MATATTNIHKAKLLNGNPVQEGDIQPGLKVTYPSGACGVVTCECLSVNEDMAEFKSTNKDWPISFTMEFNQPEFTLEEFQALQEALHAWHSWNSSATDDQRRLVHKAADLGYVTVRSYTQADWTEKGVGDFRALKQSDAA